MKQPTREQLEDLYRELPRVPCKDCGAESVPQGSVCPRSIMCPSCKARSGTQCRRPSGHGQVPTHKARWQEAERLDFDPLTTRLSFKEPSR